MRVAYGLLATCYLAGVWIAACSSDDPEQPPPEGAGAGFPEQTGSSCETAADCYPEIDGGTLEGEVVCLDRVEAGYCTHHCESDEDCCAVEGECLSGITQVCSPFESTGDTMCFLSCEDEDLLPIEDGTVHEQLYCQHFASPAFICRSSGGGSDNRKICVPGDCGVGATCTLTEDCANALECVTAFDGGYCTVPDCTTNADCPNDAACVVGPGGHNYCLRSCDQDHECSFCRPYDHWAACSGDVTFAEDGTTGQVCLPSDWPS